MKPWGVEDTKFVPSLNDKMLNIVCDGLIVAVDLLMGMSSLGALLFGLSSIGQAFFNILEFAAEGVTMLFCLTLLSLESSNSLVIAVT